MQSSLTSGCPICKRMATRAGRSSGWSSPDPRQGKQGRQGEFLPPGPPTSLGAFRSPPTHCWGPAHLEGLLCTQHEQVRAAALGGVELRLPHVGGLDELVGPLQGGLVCGAEGRKRTLGSGEVQPGQPLLCSPGCPWDKRGHLPWNPGQAPRASPAWQSGTGVRKGQPLLRTAREPWARP